MGQGAIDYIGVKGGIDINGIIKDYYVYAGEKVSAGDFVEFVVDGPTYIDFTSSVVPTVWTNNSSSSATASNEYGEWSVQGSEPNNNSNVASNAFDNSTDTKYIPKISGDGVDKHGTICLYLPEGVTIKPTSITVVSSNSGNTTNTSKVQGQTESGEWVVLGTITRTSSPNTQTFTISGDTYYKAFRIVIYKYTATTSAGSQLIDFSITSGTLKIGSDETVIETQVRPATTLPCNGVAKTSGVGGDNTGHKDIVSIYTVEEVIPEPTYTYVDFTSNPAPTSWAGSSDGKTATATNDYGDWTVSAATVESTYSPVQYAFDSSTSTAYQTTTMSANGWSRLNLILPTDVTIKPTKITVISIYCTPSSWVYGIKTDGTAVLLGTFGNNSTKQIKTITVSNDEYYSMFKIGTQLNLSSGNSTVYSFEITSGTLKIKD